MKISDFLTAYCLDPAQIDGEACLEELLRQMALGLGGTGPIPMLPSYLSATGIMPANESCCVLDAGGTNLRSALAHFDLAGDCHLGPVQTCPMPGSLGPMALDEFYGAIAAQVRQLGAPERIGFCFSYNLLMGRELDGTLQAWCKEIQVPQALGRPVGASLREALGGDCTVRLVNDSVAAMLGACGLGRTAQVGLILGTGVNVCYEERCGAIGKITEPLLGDSMIISTEVGEFDGIPKGELDWALIDATGEPELAHAEKQCAGGYLGQLICLAWDRAAEAGLLLPVFRGAAYSLAQISQMLDGHDSPIPADDAACRIARTIIHRAAKIAAILCAGPVLRCTQPGGSVNIAVEGSQFYKLSGFAPLFRQELLALLQPRGIRFAFLRGENACLKGAAVAAFSQPM